MREPKQPRKLYRHRSEETLADHADAFASGGELTSSKPDPRIQDSVPTAALPGAQFPDVPAEQFEYQVVSRHTAAAAKKTAAVADVLPTTATDAQSVVMAAASASSQRSGFSAGSVHLLQKIQQRLAGAKERVRRRKSRRDRHNESGESAISLEARLAERKLENRKVILRRIAIIVGGILGLVALVWLLFAAPFARFDATAATIKGTQAPSIIDQAKVKQIVRKYDGEPLLLLGQSDLQGELNAIPEVASVQLDVSFVNGVEISLQPAKPVFCIQRGEQCQALNQHGKVMKADPKDLENVPRLGEIPKGKKQEKVVDETLDLLAVIAPEVKAQIAQVDYSGAGQFSFKLKDGRSVNWGISEQNDLKAQILQVLLQEEGKNSFDVSLPEAPVAS